MMKDLVICSKYNSRSFQTSIWVRKNVKKFNFTKDRPAAFSACLNAIRNHLLFLRLRKTSNKRSSSRKKHQFYFAYNF